MDLGAYANIELLSEVANANSISVPRLRGYRYMKIETPVSEKDLESQAHESAMDKCEDVLREVGDSTYEYSLRTDRRIKKYMIRKRVTIDEDLHVVRPVAVKWDAVHGKLRKKLKFAIKRAEREYRKQYEAFNKYCGRDDVLYIHARIGGLNWDYYGGHELERQPWFLEKVDDSYDSTYCDIYAKIDPKTIERWFSEDESSN